MNTAREFGDAKEGGIANTAEKRGPRGDGSLANSVGDGATAHVKGDDKSRGADSEMHDPHRMTAEQSSLSEAVASWNGWPNGDFELDLCWDDWHGTGKLMTHWAHKIVGGHRGGAVDASTWQGGVRGKRVCLGILKCVTKECPTIVRPQTKPEYIDRQLLAKCRCGAAMEHYTCNITAEVWKYNDGVHYIHSGIHRHPRPTHVLHLSKSEEESFQAIVEAHPKAGPLALLVGVPTLRGPGTSVGDISDLLLNTDRIRKERQKAKKKGGAQGVDSFLDNFQEFTRENPDFVIYSEIGNITMIVMQSHFMASHLVRHTFTDNALNGIISDAAHGYWLNRKCLLIISSCYSQDLFCWVPVIFTFANGASSEHYKIHFLALFQRIAHEAEKKGITIIDELFAGVSIPMNTLLAEAVN